MYDPTEDVRRELVGEINSAPKTRKELETLYPGQVWNTDELGKAFEVFAFLAPFVVVRRKSDGVRGALTFQHDPRFYFDFEPD